MAVRTQIATVGNRGRHSSNPSDPFNLGRPGGSLMDPTAPNPFATPDFVTPAPSAPSQSSRSSGYFPKGKPPRLSAPRRRFKSSRLVGEFEKPWLEESKRTINWDAVILYTFVLAGLGISAVICWLNVRNIPNPEYCLVLEDNFETFNKDVWSHEVQMNGFGTGSFDWTTSDPANSYVDARGLHIVPTLTLESTDITYKQLTNGYTVNLTKDGTCTSREQRVSNIAGISQPCSAKSNSTKGTIINPVRSARLTTAGKKTIKYGRVEVVAKMPRGDWMWPAIWMMPQDSVYGDWPRSGEIDIAELRGNDAEEYPLGNNIVTSALHWGTSYTDDAWNKSAGEWGGKRTKYSDDFHLYSLEWSEKYLFTWLDGRLRQIIFFDFKKNKNMWTFGEFWKSPVNGTFKDPWSQTGRSNTPFDQEFYLILNVAVGGTGGWFPDGMGQKPWTDKGDTPMRDFWQANSTWLPSWGPVEDRGMIVKSVKMWQEGAC